MKGIDVSKYQGTINWKKVVNSGVEFAIIKAGYGMYSSQEDPFFQENVKGCIDNKIPFGVYWYSYAVSTYEAEKEAAVCQRVIEKYKNEISLPVFFDQEYEKGILALSNAQRTDICISFMKKMEESGYKPGLYCSYDWWISKLDNSSLSAFPLWIAQYASECSCKSNNLVCWQYSSTGRIDGIMTEVDLNMGYDSLFNCPFGWNQCDGKWYYCRDGKCVKSEWVKDDGFWYYLGSDGAMLTGVKTIDGKRYLLNPINYQELPLGACVITDKDGVLNG